MLPQRLAIQILGGSNEPQEKKRKKEFPALPFLHYRQSNVLPVSGRVGGRVLHVPGGSRKVLDWAFIILHAYSSVVDFGGDFQNYV